MWEVETLRLTVFSSAIPALEGITWWSEITGEKSETKTIQTARRVLQEVGSIREGVCKLSFECKADRIDWVLSPIIPENEQLVGLPTFGALSERIKLFRQIFYPWLQHCPATARIAFGVVAIKAVDDRAEGYGLLQKYLPSVKLDAAGSSDFSYQINRPRESKVLTGRKINRLSKWGVAALSGIVIQVTGGEPAAKVIETKKKLHACRAELDINTPAESTELLTPDRLKPLLDELIGLGLEIADKGDVP